MKLPKDFYLHEDVLHLSKQLLGKYLYTKISNQITAGMIVETEAYAGIEDKASHAYNSRLTPRTKTMYLPGGIAYIYLCYGMHYLFNVVTNKKDIPHAILIRAVEPKVGVETMLKRRRKKKVDFTLTAGPGALSQAFGITNRMNEKSLLDQTIWIEDKNVIIKEQDIIQSPRVGIAYAKEHALLPWRFRVKNNLWISRAK